MKRKALGKGLDALIPRKPAQGTGLTSIDISQIEPNAFQPRALFEKSKLDELADSILQNGVLQPVIVRRKGAGFELVAGERRWRAAQIAGLQQIPALVQDLSDQKMLELAIVENIQRDELSAIEEAHAYQLLIDEFNLSQDQVAKRVGRSRSAVANLLRLLKLPRSVQQMVVSAELSMGHARAILPLSQTDQIQLAQEIVKKGLSVREVERRVARLLKKDSSSGSAPDEPSVDPNMRAAEERLEEACQTRVIIRKRGQGGQILLHFYSDEELQRLYEWLVRAE